MLLLFIYLLDFITNFGLLIFFPFHFGIEDFRGVPCRRSFRAICHAILQFILPFHVSHLHNLLLYCVLHGVFDLYVAVIIVLLLMFDYSMLWLCGPLWPMAMWWSAECNEHQCSMENYATHIIPRKINGNFAKRNNGQINRVKYRNAFVSFSFLYRRRRLLMGVWGFDRWNVASWHFFRRPTESQSTDSMSMPSGSCRKLQIATELVNNNKLVWDKQKNRWKKPNLCREERKKTHMQLWPLEWKFDPLESTKSDYRIWKKKRCSSRQSPHTQTCNDSINYSFTIFPKWKKRRSLFHANICRYAAIYV